MASKVLIIAILLISAQLLFGYLMLSHGTSSLDGIYAEFLLFSFLIFISLYPVKWMRSVAAICLAIAMVYCIILALETTFMLFYLVASLYAAIIALLYSIRLSDTEKENSYKRISF